MEQTVLEIPTPPEQKKWSVGTLTYTAGGLVVLFCWLLWGDFVLQLKEKSVPQSLQVLLKNFQATDFVKATLVGTLPNLMAMILVPIISYRSDRFRSKWGRRIPFLLIPTPLAVLSMVGLACAPAVGRTLQDLVGAGRLSTNQATIASLAMFWAIFELASIICGAIFTALINDVVPSALLGRFFALFRIFSIAATMIFLWFLFGKVKEYYFHIFIGTGLLYGVGFGAMCLAIKEGDYPDPEAPQLATDEEATKTGDKKVVHYAKPGNPRGFFRAAAIYFRDCFSHPYYLWFYLSIALAHIAFQPILLFFYDMSVSLGMSDEQLARRIQFTQMGCSFVLAFPVGWLCDKIHSTRVTIAAIGLYGVVTLAAFFFIRDVKSFMVAQIVCGSVAGMWSTAYSPVMMALFPKREFATFYSAVGVVVPLSVMLASFVAGAMMDMIHHQYRYIYLWASVFSFLSMLTMLVVYKKFKAFGGPDAYVAPI